MERRKVALVTGGLKGIGKAISLALVTNGFTTYATTRDQLPAIEIEHLLPIKMDISDKESVREVFQLIEKQHGTLDVLVNNAGIGLFTPFEEFHPEQWEQIFRTNVFGTFLCTQNAYSLMKTQGGRIIQTSSIATQRALPYNSIYAASKHAIKGFGESLAEEWKDEHISITNVHLGATYTELWSSIEGFSKEDMLHVNDVARIVAFIATTPLHVRIDQITVTPPKGVL